MSTDSPKFHSEVVEYLEKGRRAFERLVVADGAKFAESLWALREDELRAIALERVVAERAARSATEKSRVPKGR